MEIVPLTVKEANRFVEEHHRHNGKVAGCKFCIGVKENNKLCGVAICGRPIGRYLDDGLTLEINRCCTDGTKNACSKLYGASCRIAKNMGYKKVITYTLSSENGASLRASNFHCEGTAGGINWTGKRYSEAYQQCTLVGIEASKPKEKKQRWSKSV